MKAADFSSDTLNLLSALLSTNPEYYTVWNFRRLLLQHTFAHPDASTPSEADIAAAEKAHLTVPQREISQLIEEDLRFLIPLLKQYPKCYWIWNHRAWLLAQASELLPKHVSVKFWEGELGLVGKMLSLDGRNFHGWGYRRTVVKEVESLTGKSRAEEEFAYTTMMVGRNLSNYSAWHSRGEVLPKLLDERGATEAERRKVFDGEWELVTRGLWTDPYDGSLWGYWRFLLGAVVDQQQDEGVEKRRRTPKILDPCGLAEKEHYLRQEMESVRGMLDGAEDCKFIYQALLELAPKYAEVSKHKDDSQKDAVLADTSEIKEWLDQLRKIDPLRAGRWNDLGRSLGL